MKKNIQINIFGTIYAIDEDAYQLLNNYLEGMKQYFCRQEGGDEIADDIEHRVAELLWQYKEQGMEAVNIQTVKEIINQIGNPADIDEGNHSQAEEYAEAEECESSEDNAEREMPLIDRIKRHISQHRLYRNTNEKVLGGVCSGLAEYAGVGDVVIWRLAFVLLAFFNMTLTWAFMGDVLHCIIPVLYIVMWIVVPEAKTPEDKLRMKGREVTPENLSEQIVNDSQTTSEPVSCQSSSGGGGCLRFILAAVLVLLLFPLIVSLLALIFGIVVSLVAGMGASAAVISALPFWASPVLSSSTPILLTCLMAGIIVVALPIYIIIRFIRHEQRPLSTSAIFFILLTWLVALAVAIAAGISSVATIDVKLDEMRDKENTRNGITLESSWMWNELDAMGWSLKRMANIQNDIICQESGIKGMDGSVLSFRREDATKPMDVRLERKEFLEEGDYVIEVIASAKGRGLNVKVEEEGNPQAVGSVAISEGGKMLGDIPFSEAGKILAIAEPDSAEWDNLQRQCDGHLAYYTSAPFHVKGGNATTIIEIQNAYMNNASVRHIVLHKVK